MSFWFKTIGTLLLLMTLQQQIQAQRDTLFWFVAPYLTSGHGAGPMLLRFSAFEKESKVWIEQPANNAFSPVELTVPANGTISFNLSNHTPTLMNFPPAQVLPYGLKIRSTEEIFVYYESNRGINPDIFSLKGRNALGFDFWVPMQNSYPNGGYNPPARSGFDIVATEDETTIEILPTSNAVGHPAGLPFTLQLNLGQTYSVIAESAAANAKLSGSRVRADKPIAVTMKDDSSRGPSGPCADLNGDQLVPVEVLGTEYVIVKGFLNPHDNLYVLAVEDSTDLYINGDWVGRLNQGQMYSATLVQEAIFLNSTHPVYVKHLSGYGCEVGAAILPKVNCTGSQRVSFVRSTGEDFFLILYTESGYEDSFLLNGDNSILRADLFKDVPGTQGKYKFARVTLTAAQVPVGGVSTVVNSKGLFHLGLVNGSPAGGTRYGYFSDFATFSVAATALPQEVCEGDSLGVAASFFPKAVYAWTGPEGFETSQPSWSIGQASLKDEGWYTVQAEVPGCPGSVDSLYLSVFPKPIMGNYGYTDPVCQGGNLAFFVELEEGQEVHWSGPNGFSSQASTILMEEVQAEVQGLYRLYLTEGICSSDTVALEVRVFPSYSRVDSVEICGSYTWAVNGKDYLESGLYAHSLTSAWGCDSLFYLELSLLPEFGQEDRVAVCDSFVWAVNQQRYDVSGIYEASFSNVLGCDSTHVLNLEVFSSYFIQLEETACDSFYWEGRWLASSGQYRKDTLTSMGCDSTVILDLSMYPSQREERAEIACGDFEWEGRLLVESGVYERRYSSEWGCDSVEVLDLTLHPEWEVVERWQVCDSVYWGGTWIAESGIFIELYETVEGCDSLVTVEIEVGKRVEREEWVSAISSYTWPVNYVNYSTSGRYEAVFTGSNGCDSVLILNLEIRSPDAIWLPNVFHPWGNGSNDRLYVFATPGVARIERWMIFDRWGALVYEARNFAPNSPEFGWDGTLKGEQVNVGVYVYTIEWIDSQGERRRKNGDVTLLH
jgi:gliding motility-associated-like protein